MSGWLDHVERAKILYEIEIWHEGSRVEMSRQPRPDHEILSALVRSSYQIETQANIRMQSGP